MTRSSSISSLKKMGDTLDKVEIMLADKQDTEHLKILALCKGPSVSFQYGELKKNVDEKNLCAS